LWNIQPRCCAVPLKCLTSLCVTYPTAQVLFHWLVGMVDSVCEPYDL
jgi:hypothetical protein